MIVSSPHAFSTRDVYVGHLAGLRACLGEENVVSYDIIPRYNIYTHFTELLEQETGYIPREMAANVLAAEPVLGAALMHDVDAIYFVSPMYFPMSLVQIIRARTRIKTWVYFTECPYEDEFWARAQSRFFDHVFVNDRNSLPRFRAFNPSTHYLPHAYNPAVHYPGLARSGDDRVVYVGTGFPKRRELLEAVDWSGIDLRLYGLWDNLPPGTKLKNYADAGLLENAKAADVYREATIGLSMHRVERHWIEGDAAGKLSRYIDPGEAYSLGPRAYELAACGLFQISDLRPALHDTFGPSVPVFQSSEELGKQVRKYLADPVRREELAKEQLAAVQPHTVQKRMADLLEIAA